MRFTNNTIRNWAYGVLEFLIILIIFNCVNTHASVIDKLRLKNTNLNSNLITKEGFTSSSFKSEKTKVENDNDIFKIIENKLRGLTEEIGGKSGKKEMKSILTNTKKICDIECSKCMMTMLEDTKSGKTINVEELLDDENNDNCIKCKKYTELSSTIQSLIDNL